MVNIGALQQWGFIIAPQQNSKKILKFLVEIKKEPVLLQRQQAPGITKETRKLTETQTKFLGFHIII